ncbi:MAG: hypothetical protein ABW042_03785 [Phenylobacterium sp.]
MLIADAAPAPPAAKPIDLGALLPRMKGGKQEGYQVVAPGSSGILQLAGVQRGDVLLAVDGAPLTPEGFDGLPERLASASEVELRFERGGQVMTKRVRMGGQ